VFEAGEVDIDQVGAFMESAIAKHGNDMLRYKGALAIAGESRRLIVQGIHKVVGFDYGATWEANEERRSLLVIIGRNLPIAALKEAFFVCVTR
jgi:G3E family GTPase